MAVILCDIEQFPDKEICRILDAPIGIVDEPHRLGSCWQTRLWDYAVDDGLAPTSRPIPRGIRWDGSANRRRLGVRRAGATTWRTFDGLLINRWR